LKECFHLTPNEVDKSYANACLKIQSINIPLQQILDIIIQKVTQFPAFHPYILGKYATHAAMLFLGNYPADADMIYV